MDFCARLDDKVKAEFSFPLGETLADLLTYMGEDACVGILQAALKATVEHHAVALLKGGQRQHYKMTPEQVAEFMTKRYTFGVQPFEVLRGDAAKAKEQSRIDYLKKRLASLSEEGRKAALGG